ncbi:MAG: cytochrome b N-terminal domain-containing protein [Longimicrobiales bacterium]
MRQIFDWLDQRTGYRGLLRSALYERIPGGARWRYVWGSTLVFALFVQFLTGVALWAAYSANAQGAWESVNFIQNQMLGGWVLRGIHHYMAQVTVVLLVLHLMQVVVDGAYRAPREVNFWFGLALLLLVLGMSLTGYLLPWDQKGYWATKVATGIAAMTPMVGAAMQQILVGGSEYGHLTLTRFFALHAGILPGLLVLLVVGHVYLFRRHGVTPADRSRPDGMFWPEQVLRDGVASLAVMAAVLFLVFLTNGAHLGAPADPTEPYAAARPDWYFLFLFQWLKYFPAPWEVVGAHVVPGLVVLAVAAMPFVARWRLGHRFNVGFLVALLLGIGVLTRLAFAEDAANPAFHAAKERAEADAARAAELAGSPMGIPVGGALAMMRDDPLTQGPRLFEANCSHCHTFDGHDGLGGAPAEEPAASDLAGFGSRAWLEGLLDPERVDTQEYFGATAHARGRMVRFVQRGVAGFDAEQQDQLRKVVWALSSQSERPDQAAADSADAADIAEGFDLISSESINCTRCHVFRGQTEDDEPAPDLTGWGSREWIMGMLHDPTDPAYYGADNDEMPSFGVEEILTEQQMRLLADWLRGDWYRPETP